MTLIISLLCTLSFAQVQTSKIRNPAQAISETLWQRGEVMTENTTVYESADFDSKVIGRLKLGTRWPMSKKITGAFYQVKLPGNRVGYVTDMDIANVGVADQTKAAVTATKAKLKKRAKPNSPEGTHIDTGESRGRKGARSFDKSDFQGVSLQWLRYQEETMGMTVADNMFLLGFKASGQDVVLEGINTEMNLQFSLGPPKYYEQATRRSTDGFLFLLDTMIQNTTMHGPNTMSALSFGPVFRFSKFGVTLPVAGKDEFYSMEDMAIGAKFAYGVAQRFGNFAARLEAQYYWEKNRYYGLSLSLQYGNPAR